MLERANIDLENCLLGMAVGDSMGLPMEGLSCRAIAGLGWMDKPKQRFVLGKGMISDDTEHAMMTLSAVRASNGDVRKFKFSLRSKLMVWFIGLPAGVGLATAKSGIKMWLGFRKTGVYSAGNGPAMRSAILGVSFCDDECKRSEYVKTSTLMTHTDEKALVGARVVAELAALFSRNKGASEDDVKMVIAKERLYENGAEGWEERCKKGVSGYMMNTVPALVSVGMKHDWDYVKSVSEMISMGGDTDTTAAILGALCGVKNAGMPESWINGICEFPRSVGMMKRLCDESRPELQWWLPFAVAVLVRNIIFLMIVLVHGFRRLLDFRMWN